MTNKVLAIYYNTSPVTDDLVPTNFEFISQQECEFLIDDLDSYTKDNMTLDVESHSELTHYRLLKADKIVDCLTVIEFSESSLKLLKELVGVS